MNSPAQWLIRMYAKSLVLYPRSIRVDFTDEMQAVFNLRVDDATGRGLWGLVQLVTRELINLPLVLLALYARERRLSVMQKHLNRWFVHKPGSWQEVLLACLPFLVLFLFPGIFSFNGVEDSIPAALGLGLLVLMVLILALLGISGLLVKLPRWAMPYAGVLMSGMVFLILILLGVSSLFFGQLSGAWWLRMVLFEIISLAALTATMILVVWLAQRFPLTRSFFKQVQEDWSLFSFAMYGGAMVLVLGMYEDISGAGLYILITAIPLLLGAWGYLRLRAVHWRILAMSLAVTVAMGVTLIANIQLMDWASPVEFVIGGLGITRSVLSILLTWVLCVAMLFIPMLLPQIPFSKPAQEQMA